MKRGVSNKLLGQMLILSLAAIFVMAGFAQQAIGYNSEEHKIIADIGASQVRIPAGVVLPAGVQFSAKDAGDYIRQFQNAKMLSVGFASNNESDYDENRPNVQDNFYYHTFGQSNFNLKQWIPPYSLAPSKVLYVPTILKTTAEPFSFGELVSFYGDYRRTVAPSPTGACYLSDVDLPPVVNFRRGNSQRIKNAPAPLPIGSYLRRIASGLVPPFGSKGNATGYTAKPNEYNEAGWWGDEMMRVAGINDWHFSNIAMAWYVGMHRLALVHVNKARSNPASWITALHYEACALHCLTDLFCLGHLVVNRDRTSFAINKSSGVLNTSTVGWMDHVLAMGGGTRGPGGRLLLDSGLPPINDITAQRDNSLNWDPTLIDGVAAGNENKYHDKFNASGAIVRNLNGDEFQIYGDFKMKVTPDQTRELVIRTVRESLQSLFDSYSRMQAGESIEQIGAPGSSYFRAVRYVPIWIENDPDDFFPGKWTLFAKHADDIVGTKKLPREWFQCRIPFIDGYGNLPPRTTRRALQVLSAKVTSPNSGTATPYSLTVEYVISGTNDDEKSLVEETASVTGPEKMKPITTERPVTKADGRLTKVWKFIPNKPGNYTFEYELAFKCGTKTGKVPFEVGAESGGFRLKGTMVQYGVHTDQPAGVGYLAPVYKYSGQTRLIFKTLGPIGDVYRPVRGVEIGPNYLVCTHQHYINPGLRSAVQWTGVPQFMTPGKLVSPWVRPTELQKNGSGPSMTVRWLVPGQPRVGSISGLTTYNPSANTPDHGPRSDAGDGSFWPLDLTQGPIRTELKDRIILEFCCYIGSSQAEFFRVVWLYEPTNSSQAFTGTSTDDQVTPASSTVTTGDTPPYQPEADPTGAPTTAETPLAPASPTAWPTLRRTPRTNTFAPTAPQAPAITFAPTAPQPPAITFTPTAPQPPANTFTPIAPRPPTNTFTPPVPRPPTNTFTPTAQPPANTFTPAVPRPRANTFTPTAQPPANTFTPVVPRLTPTPTTTARTPAVSANTTSQSTRVNAPVSLHNLSGIWSQSTDQTGGSSWTLRRIGQDRYDAVETGLGGATGTAVVDGNVVTITFGTADGEWQGTYQWRLSDDLTQGIGKLTFTRKPASDTKPMSLTSHLYFSKRLAPADRPSSPSNEWTATTPAVPHANPAPSAPSNPSAPSGEGDLSGLWSFNAKTVSMDQIDESGRSTPIQVPNIEQQPAVQVRLTQKGKEVTQQTTCGGPASTGTVEGNCVTFIFKTPTSTGKTTLFYNAATRSLEGENIIRQGSPGQFSVLIKQKIWCQKQ